MPTPTLTDGHGPSDWVKAQAMAAGFDLVGIADPYNWDQVPERLDDFLAKERHGDMAWMADRSNWRRDPKALWPEAQAVVMCGLSYGPDEDPLPELDKTDRGVISVYAQGRDYHDLVKKRLKQVARAMVAELGGEVKVFVDTAPVMEKPLAQRAGIGWQGKHTNLVARDGGSWMFLGAIFTTLSLASDQPEQDHCGECTRCLDICPTKAFPAPYQLDARRCISYLTIEHKGQIASEFRKAMGNRIYGCDDCLAVCPWNKFAREASDARLLAKEGLDNPPLADLLALDEDGFRALTPGSPIRRVGRDRFVRNVLVAAGNSGDQSLLQSVETLLSDPSPLVRGMAVWALGELDEGRARALKADHSEGESDPSVLEEWAALS